MSSCPKLDVVMIGLYIDNAFCREYPLISRERTPIRFEISRNNTFAISRRDASMFQMEESETASYRGPKPSSSAFEIEQDQQPEISRAETSSYQHLHCFRQVVSSVQEKVRKDTAHELRSHWPFDNRMQLCMQNYRKYRWILC